MLAGQHRTSTVAVGSAGYVTADNGIENHKELASKAGAAKYLNIVSVAKIPIVYVAKIPIVYEVQCEGGRRPARLEDRDRCGDGRG